MIASRATRSFVRSARAASRAASSSTSQARKVDYRLASLGAGFVAGGLFLSQADCGFAEVIGAADEATVAALSSKINSLEIDMASQTSSAFVFIKPHAVTEQTIALVKDKFARSGIRITSEGELDHKKIDEDMLIDTHYGAIANRAVKQKPRELIVQPKAQAAFKKAFGIEWNDAVSQGLVYNATDACTKLGVDGMGLDQEWGKLTRGTNLIKFGGGFYCGKVGDIYVMNGFYMAMRAAYTTPPASIHYFTVEWPTSSMTWADFRGKVLGATDPKEAAPGSARRLILEQWQSLGLASVPNTGDNGVHASASPFEALAERVNWLGATIGEDAYGKGMLAAGISEATLKNWSQDPPVEYEGKQQSIFDLLEDLDADHCLAKAADIAK